MKFPLVLVALLALAHSASADPTIRQKPAHEGGYSFARTMTVGGPEADDESYFYERFGPVEVAADRQGRMHVLDNGNARVQVFGTDGTFLRSIGSEGDGPGEFRIPTRLSVNAAGDIAVFDIGQGRVSVLGADGTLKRDQIVTAQPESIVLADDGRLFLGFGDRGPAKVQVFAADGALAWEGGEIPPMGGRVVKMEIGRQTVAPRLVIVGGKAVVRVPEGDYLLERFEKGSAVAFARPLERRKYTAEELAPPSEEEGNVEHVIVVRRDGPGGDGGGAPSSGGGGGGSWSAEGDEGEAMHIDPAELRKYLPTHHSATRGVLAWPDGRLWVLTSEGRKGQQVDEWSASGEWTRRFDMPEEYDWLAIGHDGKLYSVTHDEDDYPSVHRIEVTPDA
jgi:hypothetical protein